MRVIGDDPFSKPRRLRKPNVPWDDCLKNLLSVKIPEVCGDCRRQVCSFVVHGQQQAFNCEAWIVEPANPCEGIEKFGNALKRVIFALYGNQQGLRGS